MKRNRFQLGNLLSIEAGISLFSSVLVIGVTYGSLNARVKAMEQRPDPAPDIATLKAGMDDLKSDVKDIQKDIKSLLRRGH